MVTIIMVQRLKVCYRTSHPLRVSLLYRTSTSARRFSCRSCRSDKQFLCCVFACSRRCRETKKNIFCSIFFLFEPIGYKHFFLGVPKYTVVPFPSNLFVRFKAQTKATPPPPHTHTHSHTQTHTCTQTNNKNKHTNLRPQKPPPVTFCWLVTCFVPG